MPEYFKPGTRKGNRTYYVRGYIDGIRREITTKSRDKSGAEDEWAQYKRDIRAQCARAAEQEHLTFANAVDSYREAHPSLSKNEHTFIDRLRDHLGNKRLDEITLADLHGAAHALYPGRLPQTKNRNALTPAASILHYAADCNLMPWVRVKKFKETDPHRPVTMPDEAQVAIQKALDNGETELAAVLMTVVYQGWRITETLNLNRGLVNWKKKTIQRLVAKSGKWKTAPVNPDVIDAWKSLPENEDGRIFSIKDRFAFYWLVDNLGLDSHYRPHSSRRGFATHLKNQGVDEAGIAEAGQWEDKKSVSVYVGDDIERQRATLAKLTANGGKNGGRKKKAER